MSNGKKSLKILVTGATGFIGAHTIVALLREGYSVRALLRSVEKFQKVLDLHGVSVDDVVTGDVTDQEAVRKALDGCDGVIHTAAMISTQKKDQDLVYDTNVNGTRYVIGGAVDPHGLCLGQYHDRFCVGARVGAAAVGRHGVGSG